MALNLNGSLNWNVDWRLKSLSCCFLRIILQIKAETKCLPFYGILKFIFCNNNYCIFYSSLFKFVSFIAINGEQPLAEIIGWCQESDKPIISQSVVVQCTDAYMHPSASITYVIVPYVREYMSAINTTRMYYLQEYGFVQPWTTGQQDYFNSIAYMR